MIIVINLFNQLFSHTAMAHISPIHHSAGTEAAEYRRAARVGIGASYYLVAAVRSALFAAALEFKMSFFFFLSFFLPANKQRTLPLRLKAWLLCRTLSVLYYWPHIPPSGWIRPDKVFLHPAVRHTHIYTHTHTVCGLEISRGQFDKAHPPTHNKTHAHKVRTHLYALHSTSLNRSLLTNTHTEGTRKQQKSDYPEIRETVEGAQSRSDSSLWNSSFFIQIYKKKKYNRNKYTLFSTQLWNCINIVREQWSHWGAQNRWGLPVWGSRGLLRPDLQPAPLSYISSYRDAKIPALTLWVWLCYPQEAFSPTQDLTNGLTAPLSSVTVGWRI